MRSCPNEANCSRKCPISKYLCSLPAVMVLGMVWETPSSSPEDISAVLDTVDFQINLHDVFPSFTHQQTLYKLRGINSFLCKTVYLLLEILPTDAANLLSFLGMICYYGMHYDAYFLHPSRQQVLDHSRSL